MIQSIILSLDGIGAVKVSIQIKKKSSITKKLILLKIKKVL